MEKESAKIILSADSTCDLDTELKERYHVHYFPLHIILDGHDYKDGIDITPEEIFQKYYDEKILPKTAAVNVAEYIDHFEPWSSRLRSHSYQSRQFPLQCLSELLYCG